MKLVGAAVAVLSGLLVVAAARQPAPPVPFGFTRQSADQQRRTERRFLELPSATRMRDAHQWLSRDPHMAGTPRDRELAEWTAREFTAYGLEDVQTITHEVLLPYPTEVSVEMTAPRAWRASMREDPVPGDPFTQASPEVLGLPYHAYSASGDVTAPVVYAGSGNPADYDALLAKGIDIRGKIALVRYSVPYSYRGFKALTAERRGAAGILIYSDAEDDGFKKGKVYPDGPWGPDSHIQRGGIVYDFMVPGDPLTPGWASLPGARRIAKEDAVSLPKIISAPMSYKDARVILDTLPNAVVRMRVQSDDRVRPIWTVTGVIRGAERPDEIVIVGNHRDAWIYGGVDPSSGSAALMELARTLGTLAKNGMRPRRTILFASWDAEEFTLTSSTEWGEQHEAWLKDRAIAYLNVDSAASGPNLKLAAVPSLNRLLSESARSVRNPVSRLPLEPKVDNRLGSGSDYTVFLNFLGLPIADLTFDGPYGVYHSMYDNHRWVSRIGDPGFRFHVSLVQLWGLAALRLANADTVPLDPVEYATRIDDFLKELTPRTKPSMAGEVADLREAIAALKAEATRTNAARDKALADADKPGMDGLNRRLMTFERALTDAAGIPGRPWYRHLIYAPKFTYAPEMLPGVSEALDRGDERTATAEIVRLSARLRAAAAHLARENVQ
jgi:N-acetylated-alpha-linked acidic dipeptidase